VNVLQEGHSVDRPVLALNVQIMQQIKAKEMKPDNYYKIKTHPSSNQNYYPKYKTTRF
jgi:hypothetical protein